MSGFRKTVLSVCACLLCFPGGLYGSSSLDDARLRIDDGRYAEAVGMLSDFLSEHPGHSEALKLRALSQSGLGRFDDAIDDYEGILTKCPDDAEAHLDLGMILALKKKDARHALVHLDRYLSLQRDQKDQRDEERTAKAAAVMVSVDGQRTRLEKRAVEDLMDMAREFESEGNAAVAMRAYERVLEIHPTCASCHESLGKLLIQERNASKGEQHLAKAKLFRTDG